MSGSASGGDSAAQRFEAVLLAGPTASGKSALALELARRHNSVVINADSMQVYADLDRLSARPDPAELAQAPHRLYGHVDGALNYSVGRWLPDVATELAAARTAGRLPIVIGGTGLYFRALERGLAQMPSVPDTVRQAVRAQADTLTSEALHASLAARDPLTAAGLRPSDRQRLIRALEVFEATGRPLADWQTEPHSPPLIDGARCLRLFLAPERAWLYERIDRRFDGMIDAGALDEVAALAARNLDPALPVMRAHGVPWLLRHLKGEIGAPEAIAGSKADTRHYAKRQFTWFRHQMPGWSFVAPAEATDYALAALAA